VNWLRALKALNPYGEDQRTLRSVASAMPGKVIEYRPSQGVPLSAVMAMCHDLDVEWTELRAAVEKHLGIYDDVTKATRPKP